MVQTRSRRSTICPTSAASPSNAISSSTPSSSITLSKTSNQIPSLRRRSSLSTPNNAACTRGGDDDRVSISSARRASLRSSSPSHQLHQVAQSSKNHNKESTKQSKDSLKSNKHSNVKNDEQYLTTEKKTLKSSKRSSSIHSNRKLPPRHTTHGPTHDDVQPRYATRTKEFTSKNALKSNKRTSSSHTNASSITDMDNSTKSISTNTTSGSGSVSGNGNTRFKRKPPLPPSAISHSSRNKASLNNINRSKLNNDNKKDLNQELENDESKHVNVAMKISASSSRTMNDSDHDDGSRASDTTQITSNITSTRQSHRSRRNSTIAESPPVTKATKPHSVSASSNPSPDIEEILSMPDPPTPPSSRMTIHNSSGISTKNDSGKMTVQDMAAAAKAIAKRRRSRRLSNAFLGGGASSCARRTNGLVSTDDGTSDHDTATITDLGHESEHVSSCSRHITVTSHDETMKKKLSISQDRNRNDNDETTDSFATNAMDRSVGLKQGSVVTSSQTQNNESSTNTITNNHPNQLHNQQLSHNIDMNDSEMDIDDSIVADISLDSLGSPPVTIESTEEGTTTGEDTTCSSLPESSALQTKNNNNNHGTLVHDDGLEPVDGSICFDDDYEDDVEMEEINAGDFGYRFDNNDGKCNGINDIGAVDESKIPNDGIFSQEPLVETKAKSKKRLRTSIDTSAFLSSSVSGIIPNDGSDSVLSLDISMDSVLSEASPAKRARRRQSIDTKAFLPTSTELSTNHTSTSSQRQNGRKSIDVSSILSNRNEDPPFASQALIYRDTTTSCTSNGHSNTSKTCNSTARLSLDTAILPSFQKSSLLSTHDDEDTITPSSVITNITSSMGSDQIRELEEKEDCYLESKETVMTEDIRQAIRNLCFVPIEKRFPSKEIIHCNNLCGGYPFLTPLESKQLQLSNNNEKKTNEQQFEGNSSVSVKVSDDEEDQRRDQGQLCTTSIATTGATNNESSAVTVLEPTSINLNQLRSEVFSKMAPLCQKIEVRKGEEATFVEQATGCRVHRSKKNGKYKYYAIGKSKEKVSGQDYESLYFAMVRERRRVRLDGIKRREHQLEQKKHQNTGQFGAASMSGNVNNNEDEHQICLKIPEPQREDVPSDPILAQAHHEYFKAIDEALGKYKEAVISHSGSNSN